MQIFNWMLWLKLGDLRSPQSRHLYTWKSFHLQKFSNKGWDDSQKERVSLHLSVKQSSHLKSLGNSNTDNEDKCINFLSMLTICRKKLKNPQTCSMLTMYQKKYQNLQTCPSKQLNTMSCEARLKSKCEKVSPFKVTLCFIFLENKSLLKSKFWFPSF